MNIFGDPSCTFQQFSQHLRHSPAYQEVLTIWKTLLLYRVDPAVALGFFHHESNCGNAGRSLQTKSWGNIRWLPVYQEMIGIKAVDGFCAYPNFTAAVAHFCTHLLGRDGTSSYKGLTTVEQVVPVWAPTADGNTPTAYIRAVELFAVSLGQGVDMTKPRILLVAGHNNIGAITEDGLCDNLDKTATVAKLKTSTGSRGEAAYTGDFVQRLSDAINATGLAEARFTDAVYHSDLYITWKPTVVLVIHYHRDADSERAMFAAPDPGAGFISVDAEKESQRLVDRLAGGYEKTVGIPVTDPLVTLNMTQLYTWCYLDLASQGVCVELGNANLDAGVLYNDILKVVTYIRDCLAEHLSLGVVQPPPQRRSTDVPPAVPTVPEDKLSHAKQLAQQIVDL